VDYEMSFSQTIAMIYRIVARRAPVIALAGVLVAVLGILAGILAPPKYLASVQIVMLSNSGVLTQPSDLSQGQQLARNYASLVKTDAVLQDAVQNLKDSWSVGELRERVDASPSRDSFYLTVTVTDAKPQRAADGVNAVAASFLRRVQAVQSQIAEPAIQNLRDQVAGMTEQIKTIDERVAALQKLEPSAAGDPASQLLAATSRNGSIATLLSARVSMQERLDKANTDLRLALAKQRETAVLWAPAQPPDQLTSLVPVWLAGVAGLVAMSLVTLVYLVRDWGSLSASRPAMAERAVSRTSTPPA